MKCRKCKIKPVRKVVDKTKPSVKVVVPANLSNGTKGFNFVYPSYYADDQKCLQCYSFDETRKPFKVDRGVNSRWSNVFINDVI